MDNESNKSNISTTGTPGTPGSTQYSDTLANNVKYINLNFDDNSESSSQTKDAVLEYQKFQNSFDEPKITKPPASKILPTSLNLPGMEKSKNNSNPVFNEKTLLEMGFQVNDVDGWENIVQPPKENLYKLLKNMITNHIKPNVQIRIGSINFNCHMMVLQCYSDFFMECSNEVLIQLPEEKITPGAFVMVYDWMLAEEPLIQREGILELFNAANFLRIKELINQCWLCLDDDVRFREDTAFLLYLEARNYGLESLEQLMLMRICKFFLTLVASKEFLSLNAKEICTLLTSNTIGVNSEIEIFMSVVRWLSHNWEEREQHMLDVIKCVRFSLMPPWFLVTLTKDNDCLEIDRVVSHSEVKKCINDGISFTTTQLYYGENREEFLHFLERYKLVAPMQRQWVFDKKCSYHHRLECPNMQYVTYKSFLEYIEMIQTIGKDYWRSLEMAKGVGKSMQCCLRSDSRKSVDPNLATVFTKQSRDQGIQCENDSRHPREMDYYNKTYLTNNIRRKNSIRSTPRGHSKYIPSTVATTVKQISINNDNATETETTVDFKCPKESDVNQYQQHSQQPENILYDNNHQKSEVKEQHITNCHQTVQQQRPNIQLSNNIDNNLKSKPQQQKQQKPQQQYQQFSTTKQIKQHQQQRKQLQQQQKYIKKTTAAAADSCKVIYKPADGIMANVSSNDTIAEGGEQNHHRPHHHQQCFIGDNHDVESMKHNIGLVRKKPIVCNVNEDLLECRTATKQTTSTSVVGDMKSIPNHKILVFGGIDPYCLHYQHVQQHQMYIQQQQHQHLKQHQQQKRVLSIDTINRNHSSHRHHHHQHYSHSPAYTAANAFANNKFENFGDHVLLYDGGMEWRHLSHIPLGSRHHHAVVVCNGLIYVIGGTKTALGCTKKSVFEKSIWCFNPKTLKWTLECNLPECRRDFAVIAINHGNSYPCEATKNKGNIHDSGFYIIGGEGVNGAALNTVWFYNVNRKVWIKKPSLNIGRYGLAAAMVNNEIWIAGGIINDNTAGICGNNNNVETTKSTRAASALHVITDTMEIYNLKCTHEILANNDAERFTNITGKYGGRRKEYDYVDNGAGGDNFDGRDADGIIDKVCGCNVGQWIKSKQHLRLPRLFAKFCKMSNGHLYLVGGIGLNDNGNLTSLTDIDKYNLEQKKWEHFGDLNCARHGHDVGTLNDHSIVVIGGVSTLKKHTLTKVETFCTKTRKCLKDLPDLPWPVSGCAVVTL